MGGGKALNMETHFWFFVENSFLHMFYVATNYLQGQELINVYIVRILCM